MAPLDFIFIHGWATDQSIWRSAQDYFREKHRVFAVDLPPMVKKHTYREAVGRLIKEQGLTRVILVGWSMGSLVALQTAQKWPGVIEGLVLVSGTGKFVQEKTGPDHGGLSPVLVTRMKQRLVKNPGQTLEEFYLLMFSQREKAIGLERLISEKYLSQGRPWGVSEASAGLDYLLEVDCRGFLSTISCPTLILHGVEDAICPVAGAIVMQGCLPQARLVVFPGCGHMPFLTNMTEFHQCLEEWAGCLSL